MPYSRWVGFSGVCIGLRMGPAGCDPDLMRRLEDAAARLETVDVRCYPAMNVFVLGLERLAGFIEHTNAVLEAGGRQIRNPKNGSPRRHKATRSRL